MKEPLMTLPTKEELARRQKLVAKILANADKRVIVPLTTADLVHQVRQERDGAYERWILWTYAGWFRG